MSPAIAGPNERHDRKVTFTMSTMAVQAAPSAAVANPDAQVRIGVKNLDFYYGAFHALKNININFGDREVTALIGPSGCGKSTDRKSVV